jgi:heat shock protein HslJ
MMRRAMLAGLLLVIGGLAAACGGNDTEALTGRTWYLVSGSEANPPWQWTVPLEAMGRYTVIFNTDGTFNATADCNQLAGTWDSGRNNGLSVVPGPMTMAFCGEGSFDLLYASVLAQAASWNATEQGLDLALADGGILAYTSTAPAVPSPSSSPAPTPSPTPAATATATPTPTATPEPTPTATAKATATPKPTAKPTSKPTPTPQPTPQPTPRPTPTPTPAPTATPAPGGGLVGPTWQLSALTLSNPPFQGTVPPAQRAAYTLVLAPDGTFAAQADCNTVNGTYTAADPSAASGSLTLVPGPATLVMCPEGSYSELYITALSGTTGYAVTGPSLQLTLSDGGTLEYSVAR